MASQQYRGLNNDQLNFKLAIMRFHFFASKDVPESTSTNDICNDIDANFIQKQINKTLDYRTVILIGMLTLLLIVYSFIAYSFLKTTSGLLFDDSYHTQIYKNNYIDQESVQRDTVSVTSITVKIKTILIDKSNKFVIAHDSFQNYNKFTLQDNVLQEEEIVIICISQEKEEIDSLESLQTKNKTILV